MLQKSIVLPTLPTSRGVRRLRTTLVLTCAVALVAGLVQATGERTPSPEGATVSILSPANGATVSSPVTVQFGLAAMGVAPAGVEREKTGHHHLLVDVGLPDPSLPIPSDANHRHFGGGQTQVQLELPPGPHTLQLLLGDHLHIPHDPPVASEILTITVQ